MFEQYVTIVALISITCILLAIRYIDSNMEIAGCEQYRFGVVLYGCLMCAVRIFGGATFTAFYIWGPMATTKVAMEYLVRIG